MKVQAGRVCVRDSPGYLMRGKGVTVIPIRWLDTLPELSYSSRMAQLRNVKVQPRTHAILKKLLKLRDERYILDLVEKLADEELQRQTEKK